MRVEIVGGAHTDAEGNPSPNSPLVVVDNHGIHVDMSTVPFGQLWDGGKTIARVTWGHRAVDGRIFGTVLLKTGAGRTFWDPNLIDPYVKAWNLVKAVLDEKAKAAAPEPHVPPPAARTISSLQRGPLGRL